MSNTFPNDSAISGRSIKVAISGTHPEYTYWQRSWETIRDCMIGEYEIKEKGTKYLPQLPGHSDEDYRGYLSRAYFYNMTSRTVNGLVGTIFRREPKVHGLDPSLNEVIKKVTKSNASVESFAKEIAQEIFTVGRYGVLLDMDDAGKGTPFFAGYVAENILDWTVSDIDGRFELTRVVLREVSSEDADSNKADQSVLKTSVGTSTTEQTVGSKTFTSNYRILSLDNDRVYRQYIFRDATTVPSIDDTKSGEQVTPTKRGVPFNFIPFMFFGPLSNLPSIDKSPILDIALMNISHYQSSAMLEHGRFFTAMPVYHINVANQEESKGAYTVGPSVVWEWSGDKAPGVIEYNGQGLKFLESALDMKEQHISALGGRMLGVRSSAVAESDNLIKLKEKNEQSLLLNASTVINIGLSELLKWWAQWQNKPFADIRIELNQDFLFDALSAREFRAFVLMYQEGVLPVEVLYSVMRKAEIIPEYMTFDEYKRQIANAQNFPNNPDIKAKQAGFPDAAGQLKHEMDNKTLKQEMSIAEMAAEVQRQSAEAAAKAAANKPKPPARA